MRKNLNTMKIVGMNVRRVFIFSSIVRKQWITAVNRNYTKTYRCEEWEERNEICDVKHSPEVV